MRYRLALYISRIAHPINLLVAFVIYTLFSILEPAKATWTVVGILLLGILPLIIWNRYHTQKGRYSNFDVSIRRQRYSLYPWILFLGGLVILFLWVNELPNEVLTGGLILIQLLLLSFLLNFRIKVSLHLAIAGYVALAISPISFGLGVLLFVTLPLIAWSRWQLGRHRSAELVWGASLGLICGVQLLLLTP
ncbi:hypothetical protein [Cyclobacterium jeungdonense]|uniref:PAP2 superfamily protein n=1 Tax=Cyclobacterium jeungdonense TaxID=708087 RepID=A0ABT8C5S6_9BACT|nr:hypothetical protein [Cyclobacterium jeungdonense]MDN3688144.1 hypothetical protein [Cyclobacterium jeungdonense]